jgi:uncharacterized protein (DUF885 family)
MHAGRRQNRYPLLHHLPPGNPMPIRPLLLFALLLLPFVSAHAAPGEAQRLATLLDAYWEETLARNPVLATAIGDLRFNDQLPNSIGPAFIAESRAFLDRWSRQLASIDRAALAGQDRLSYDILQRDLAEAIEGQRFPSELLPINQFGSLPSFFAQLGSGKSLQPFQTVKHYDDFIARGDRAVVWMDQAIENMREGARRGIVQPRIVMQKVLPQLAAMQHEDASRTVFWGPIDTMPASVDAAERERLTEAYRAAISTRWLPAYARLHDFIRDEYLPLSRDSVGLAALPDGKA